LNGTFVTRKLPSLPVVISRVKPLTGFEISTLAPAILLPTHPLPRLRSIQNCLTALAPESR
jgi:hypothetical protein